MPTLKAKNDSDEMFFGNYKKPELLEKLKEYEKSDENFWMELGFYIAYDHHYVATPLDVIPFAGTGSDGIHFAFLTDFGEIKDLNEAPVVCVAPSDDPLVKLIAKNLEDFLSLVSAVGQAEFLNEDYKTDKEATERVQGWDEGNEEEAVQGRVPLIKILKEQFKIKPMVHVSKYIKDLRKARKEEITIKTADEIGIIYGNKKLKIKAFDYKSNDTAKVKKYLEKASLPERLKFYRDATECYVLSKGYDKEIQKTLIPFLKKDGFKREAWILEEKY